MPGSEIRALCNQIAGEAKAIAEGSDELPAFVPALPPGVAMAPRPRWLTTWRTSAFSTSKTFSSL